MTLRALVTSLHKHSRLTTQIVYRLLSFKHGWPLDQANFADGVDADESGTSGAFTSEGIIMTRM
jgi:hypothetical protein